LLLAAPIWTLSCESSGSVSCPHFPAHPQRRVTLFRANGSHHARVSRIESDDKAYIDSEKPHPTSPQTSVASRPLPPPVGPNQLLEWRLGDRGKVEVVCGLSRYGVRLE
jgi:hypothetical protein